ncbi:MAG TPA: RNB domain-containing ribonuclease, partial [Thermoanaerobaculia bacterium]
MRDRPGATGLLREQLVARLEEAGRPGLLREELAEGVEAGTDSLDAALRGLEERGRAVELDGRWYAARHADGAVGTVERQDGGDALILVAGGPGMRPVPGYFVRRRRLLGASPGDTVLVRRVERKQRRRGSTPPEAEVVKILGQRYATVVGTIEADSRGAWLVPFDVKVPLELAVDGAAEVPADHYVVVAVERQKPGRPPRGRVIEVLGDPEVPGVDVLVVLRHHGIVEAFPDEVEQAAAAFPADPQPADWAGRLDLRRATVVTIDGESSRDFDDAVSIERLADGAFRLGVHIADVAHYVREGTLLDAEAYARGTSVYYPERAIPMLPEALSNGLCSLRPHVPRLTLSVFLDVA